jgi:hypothetical protein
LTEDDGKVTVYFRACDWAGNIASLSDSIILDTTPPHSLVISINQGVAHTITTIVKLWLNAEDDTSGVDKMAFSNDGQTYCTWEEFSVKRSHILTRGEGIKDVYFVVTDRAGNVAKPVKSQIVLKRPDTPLVPHEDEKKPDIFKVTEKFNASSKSYSLIFIIIILVIIAITGYTYRVHRRRKRLAAEREKTRKPVAVKALKKQ